MTENFAGGLSAQTRKKIVTLLNETLADTIALRLAVKQAHWTLKGPGYIGVHKLLDEVSARLGLAADEMAERAVILGGTPLGTAEAVAGTRIAPYPTDIEPIDAHVDALKDRFLALGETLRKAIDAAGDAGDEGTADLLTGASRAVDKDAWFIGANAAPG